MRLLITLLAYIIGMVVGALIRDYGWFIILVTIPCIIVFIINDRKQSKTDKFIKEWEEKTKNQ